MKKHYGKNYQLPNLYEKRVAVEFIQQIVERGTSYLNLSWAQIIGDQLNFAKPNSLKYLILCVENDAQKNILASCTHVHGHAYARGLCPGQEGQAGSEPQTEMGGLDQLSTILI